MIASIYFYINYKDKIRYIIPLIILNLVLSMIAFFNFGLKDYIIISVLLNASIIDIKDRILPNFFIILLLLTSITLELPNFTIYDIFTLVILFTIFLLSVKTSSIGMGDAKLFTVLYLLKGAIFFHSVLFILSILIFIFSIILFIKNRNIKVSFPLIPFISIAFIILRSLI